jgi:PAS domain-containing protein
MLKQLSDQLRECHERAAEARAKADQTGNPEFRAIFLDTENRRLTLARSIGVGERLDAFIKKAAEGEQSEQSVGAAHILRSIVENSGDAIVTKNLDGIILS